MCPFRSLKLLKTRRVALACSTIPTLRIGASLPPPSPFRSCSPALLKALKSEILRNPPPCTGSFAIAASYRIIAEPPNPENRKTNRQEKKVKIGEKWEKNWQNEKVPMFRPFFPPIFWISFFFFVAGQRGRNGSFSKVWLSDKWEA